LFLKSVEIFAHAAIEELGRIATLMQEVRFESGETIYREGNPIDAVYVILRGRVAVQNGGRVVREAGEHHVIGALAALDLGVALRTVTALEPVQVLKLSVQDFQDLLASDFELVKAVFRVIAQQIRTGF
ncbi:MAG TPA: cyclic nucleotide-binding domain-containing protein, partial [Candidatus Binatia bacterium]